MHIKVMPSQIPQVWEAIKFGLAQIGEVPNEYMATFCTTLLCDLLSEKAQCWVSLNEDRILLNISITKMQRDAITGEAELYIDGFYAWQGTTPTGIAALFNLYKDFARQSKCVRLAASSKVPRAREILEQHGFQAQRIAYTFALEG